ncbi:endonuclease, partial [Arthrobacter sp. SDTb3-6]|nr:endonuclease [Arthrobacter sp. SDTb3-6]
MEGLAAGVAGGVVDGVLEDPVQDHLDQLDAVRDGAVVAEPPLPAAQLIVTVPVLGPPGVRNEPAELAGHGPITEETARKLLAGAGTFLRLLVDPVTNTPG